MIHAGLQAALPIADQGVRRHRDDRNVALRIGFETSSLSGCLKAVHLRHLYVRQDQVLVAQFVH